MSFFDDCYLILGATHPLVPVNSQTKFTNEWLERAKHPSVKQFQNDIREYRQAVGDVVNTLKHNQGILRSATPRLITTASSCHLSGYSPPILVPFPASLCIGLDSEVQSRVLPRACRSSFRLKRRPLG